MKASREAGADLRGERADRGARRRRRPAPPARIADEDEPEAAPVEVDEQLERRRASAASPRPRPRPRARPSRRAARVAPTRPRVSRAKAFSSRSSASEPATSSSVTNISVNVAATAIAKMSSGGASRDHLLVDLDRLGDRGQQRVGEVEVLAGEVGEADHLVELLAQRAGRQPGAACRGSVALVAGRGCRSPPSKLIGRR